MASNIKQLLDYYWIELDIKIHIAILLLPLVLLVCVRDLKYLAPFSVVANLIIFLAFGFILYYLCENITSPADRNAFGLLSEYPLFFGTALLSLTSLAVTLSVESNMKTPKSFGGYFGVFNMAIFCIVCVYVVIGFFGYLHCNGECEGSITLNLPEDEM